MKRTGYVVALAVMASVLVSLAVLGEVKAQCTSIDVCGDAVSGKLAVGSMDEYCFQASKGETVVVLMAELVIQQPWLEPTIELLDANNRQLQDPVTGDSSASVVYKDLPYSGTYKVICRDDDGVDAADYGASVVRIPLKIEAEFCQTLQSGKAQQGSLKLGGQGAYSICASKETNIRIRMAEIATQPWIEPTIELYSPDGQFLDQNTNSESATINVTATVTGRYTVICRDANGQAGSYGVSANFISDPSCELAPPSPTCKPRLLLEGDVDGNGTVDITDPIYLLSYLFLGGHPPAPICGGPLPSTGQIKCFDAAGAEIDCANSDCPGQDGLYQSGCPTEGRFVDNGDGTVTDKCTGLMWQKAAADVNGDGQSTEEDVIRWCDALTYCQGLDFAGHHDWRLPNVRELQSIVDYSRFNPAIDPAFDLIPFTSFFWSSTSSVASPDSVWGVFFSSGSVTAELKPEGGNIVRAVRNAR